MNTKQIAEENLILKIKSGSHLYGTNTADSDVDHVGVCIPTKDYILGIYKFEQYEERTNPCNSEKRNTKFDSDLTIYSVQKFIKLLADNNPNILELLYAPDDCIVYCDNFGRELLKHKELFVSRRAYYKFMGYAIAQKRKLIEKDPTGLRLEIVKTHGYDTKYASHLIRLLLFGVELLNTGGLKLPAEHREYLMSIRNGEWPLSRIIDRAAHLEKDLERALQHTKIPEKPDLKAICDLQVALIEEHWRRKGQINDTPGILD